MTSASRRPLITPPIWLIIKTGMRPSQLNEIEIRGENIDTVKRPFNKPNIVRWTDINKFWGVQKI